jgi:peroxiredoxin
MKPILARLARPALWLVLLAATCGLAPAPQDADPPPDAEKKKAPARATLGELAPELVLKDTTGQERSLSSYRGKIVVLEWTDPDCPVVQRLYRSNVMQDAYTKVKSLDRSVVWLAIDSTPSADPERGTFWIQQYKIAYPVLLDVAGKVARRYAPERTPHVFVIDRAGVLRFHGAIDDNRLGAKPRSKVRNFVVETVGRLLADEEISPNHVKPYGCVIKR